MLIQSMKLERESKMNLKKKFQPDPALDVGQSIAFLRMASIHKTDTGYELKPVFSLKTVMSLESMKTSTT